MSGSLKETSSTHPTGPAKPLQVIEVGPRDGLQNEHLQVPVEVKCNWVAKLIESGIREIELTSFVSPKRVPQLADADELWSKVQSLPNADEVHFSALVPNRRGLDRALALNVNRIALFTAASNSFTKNNIGMTIDESLHEFEEVIKIYREAGHQFVRGYVSTVVACPYEGSVSPDRVVEVVRKLIDLGVNEISLGETLGVAVPSDISRLLEKVLPYCSNVMLAGHFHDTRGTAIANISEAVKFGITRFDSSSAGLGGCPYAPGAGGNVATEDLVYFAEKSGFATNVSLNQLSHSSLEVLDSLKKLPMAKVQVATLAACRQS